MINQSDNERSPEKQTTKKQANPVQLGGLNTPHFDDSDLVEDSEVVEVQEKDEKAKKKDKKSSKRRKKEKDLEPELPKTKKKGTAPVIDTQLDLDTSDSEVNEAIERMRSTQKENLMSGRAGDFGMLSEQQIKDIKQSRKKKDIQTRLNVFLKNSDMLIYNHNNVSKTFKKLLSTQRMISSRRNFKDAPIGLDSKAAKRRSTKELEVEQDVNKDIEKKF